MDEDFQGTINESVVLVGGGGGVYHVAKHLKHSRPNITTIQTVFDHGGHSGMMRDQRGVLPPGDLRQAILALADNEIEDAMRVLLGHRFKVTGNSSLDRATTGNIMLAALTEHYGDPVQAIDALCRIARVRGKVLPVSLDDADLEVTFDDGTSMKGEGHIDTRSMDDPRHIVRASLTPHALLYAGAYEAIVKAHKIVFCPGDFWTSLIPTVLTKGFSDALKKSSATLVYVVNLMTKKTETHSYDATAFTKRLCEYLGIEKIHVVICNTAPVSPDNLARYEAEQGFPVHIDEATLQEYAHKLLIGDYIEQTGGILRHSRNVARTIASI